MQTLLDKLQKLKNYFLGNKADPQDVSTIESWEAEAKRLFLIQSLKNHDGIKYVIEIFKTEIENANSKLLSSYSKDFPDSERDRILDKRDLAQKYLDLFDIEKDLQKIEDAVDKETIA